MTETPEALQKWKDETTAFDRVYSIASTTTEPKPASYIADEALVAENTARKHLERLVDIGVLLKTTDERPAKYIVDPLHARQQTIRDVLNEHDLESLIKFKEALYEKLESYKNEYGVNYPESLRKQAGDTESAEETKQLRKAANDWDYTAYMLHIANDVLDNWEAYTNQFTPTTEQD